MHDGEFRICIDTGQSQRYVFLANGPAITAANKTSWHRHGRQERQDLRILLFVFFYFSLSPRGSAQDHNSSLCELRYHANGMMMFVVFFGAQRKEPQRLFHWINRAILAASRQLGRPISNRLGVSWRPPPFAVSQGNYLHRSGRYIATGLPVVGTLADGGRAAIGGGEPHYFFSLPRVPR